MATARQILRAGIRACMYHPGLVLTAGGTLTLGIAASILAFTFVNKVFIAGLPYPTIDRLVWISSRAIDLPFVHLEYVSSSELKEWRRESHSVANWAAYAIAERNLNGPSGPERAGCAAVSTGFLRAFGLETEQGRAFLPEEQDSRSSAVAIVTNRLWRRQFGARAFAVGGSIRLDGTPYLVVGVLPSTFQFPDSAGIDVLTPLSEGERNLKVIAELLPNVSVAQARADLERIHRHIPDPLRGLGPGSNALSVRSLQERQTADVRSPLLALLTSANAVWLLACVNLALLLLARGIARRPEVALRSALGASRFDLFRLFLAENFAFVATASIAAFFLASVMQRLLTELMPHPIIKLLSPRLGFLVWCYAGAIALATVTIFSAILLRVATFSSNVSLLKGGTAGSAGSLSPGRVAKALLVGELAMTIVLVSGAATVVRAYWQQRYEHLGFVEQHALTFRLDLADWKYGQPHERRRLLGDVSAAVARLPAVQGVAFCSSLPPSPLMLETFNVEGSQLPHGGLPPLASAQVVSLGYFRLMGIPLLEGRPFTEEDGWRGAGVVIVNRRFARRFLESEQRAVGRRISVPGRAGLRVVGVVGDFKNVGLSNETEPEIFVPSGQETAMAAATFVVRTASADPLTLSNAVRLGVHSTDSEQPIADVQTMEHRLTQTVAPLRFAMAVLVVFAVIGIAIAVMGAYGISSYLTECRAREIGVRLAVGARPFDVALLILRGSLGVSALGGILGIVLGITAWRWVSGLLPSTGSHFFSTLACVALCVVVISCAAAQVPVQRILAADPLRALRSE